VHLTVSV